MDINSVVDKAKELADKGLELAEEYELKEKANATLEKGKEYAGVAMEKAKALADEYELKDKAGVALEKGKEYAAVAMDKGKELYKKGMDLAEEYEVKDKAMNFIDKVGEKAEKINDAREDALSNKIYAKGEVVSEEEDNRE